jgi:tRNA threonylcarbamoyladenosine biosynthesis protein TsaE
MTENTLYTQTYLQTQKLGEKIAAHLNKIQVLALHGDLGSGKTTFMQGIANKLRIKNHMISPTFIIMRTYTIPTQEKITKKHLYHVDLYRIQDEKEIEGLGLIEIMNDPKNIVAIEWPEKIASFLPKKKIDINFQYINENTRKITITE